MNEEGKKLLVSDDPFVGKIKIFDFNKKCYAITSKGILELGSGKPLDGLSPNSSSKIVDAFVIQNSLFFVIKSGSMLYDIYSFNTKRTVANRFQYENKDTYTTTSRGIYFSNFGDECVRINPDATLDHFEMNGIFKLIEIDDRVITGIQKENKTFDVETGKAIMNSVVFDRVPDTDILITLSSKGPYRGLKEYKTNRILAPAIFDNIFYGSLIVTCELNNENYAFNKSLKEFDQRSSQKLISRVFTSINWENRKWE